MWAALANGERRQQVLLLLLVVGLLAGKDHAPTGLGYLLAGCLELYIGALAKHGSGAEFAVGVEHGNEVCRYKVIDLFLEVCKPLGIDSGGDYGVVVGYLLVVEHLFRFHKRFAHQRRSQCLVVA